MQKIVIFNSSPRLRGAVSQILEKLMQGARDASSEVVLYNLNHANIRGCQGCMYCKKRICLYAAKRIIWLPCMLT